MREAREELSAGSQWWMWDGDGCNPPRSGSDHQAEVLEESSAFPRHFSCTPSVSKEQSPHSQPLRCGAEPGELTFVWLRVELLPLQLGGDFPSAAGKNPSSTEGADIP